MSSRIALKHAPSAKGKIVVPTERDVHGKVAPPKVIPATKAKKPTKPLVGGPAARHQEKTARRI
jgi:hypothetical protein